MDNYTNLNIDDNLSADMRSEEGVISSSNEETTERNEDENLNTEEEQISVNLDNSDSKENIR